MTMTLALQQKGKQAMTVDEVLDDFEAINKQWIEWCMNCKHAYKRKNDDTLWCRLRKRECPHVAERKEK